MVVVPVRVTIVVVQVAVPGIVTVVLRSTPNNRIIPNAFEGTILITITTRQRRR
jgi:hypothetical protein